MRRKAATVAVLVALACGVEFGQAPEGPAIAREMTPVRKAVDLLRAGDGAGARRVLDSYLKAHPEDGEGWFQLARTHLAEFYRGGDAARKKLALSLAMEALGACLSRDRDHIHALRAKSVIHARAELGYYDPNLAYELAARVVKLQPGANEYLLNLSEWMTGEVRFTHESGHRVPHDPQVGLDRSMELLEKVIASATPYSTEEGAALFLMGKTLGRRGNHRESVTYYLQALERAQSVEQGTEVRRELGSAYYRMGNYSDAAKQFYEILQVKNSNVDQWMLKVAMDGLGSAAPQLPGEFLFPVVKAAGAMRFRDMAPRLGVNRFDGNGTSAWGDIDGDGDLDLMLAGSGTFLAVYRNDGGKFLDVTREVGLAGVPSGYSLNLVDYDNDGRVDLYLALNGWNGPMKNRLYRNMGGRFADVTEKSGTGDAGSGFVSLWGDLDNDGDLDLVVANGVLKDGSVPQIYRNNGDGTFANVTRAAGLHEPAEYGAIGIALGDYDNDGDLDLLVNGLDRAPNRLYRNDGKWKFTEVAQKAGLTQPAHNGFVCFFFDYDNDGWQDVMTTSLAAWDAVVEGLKPGYAPASARGVHADAVRLFKNLGDGTFRDVTFEAKLYRPMGVMGAGVADLDNDGYLDIYFGTGDPQLTRLEPNRLFRNLGDGTFADVTEGTGFARPGNKGHGVTFVDIDGDGDLDVYAQLGGHYQGDHAHNAFYENLNGGGNHWLQVDLQGVKSNRGAVGAVVRVKVGEMTMMREVKGSEGFGATNPLRVHFGLGKAEQVESIEVRWPTGEVQRVEAGGVDRVVQVEELK